MVRSTRKSAARASIVAPCAYRLTRRSTWAGERRRRTGFESRPFAPLTLARVTYGLENSDVRRSSISGPLELLRAPPGRRGGVFHPWSASFSRCGRRFESVPLGPRMLWKSQRFAVLPLVRGRNRASGGSFGRSLRVRGRKRHVLVDSLGLPIAVLVSSGYVSDIAGGRRLLYRARLTKLNARHRSF